MVAKSFQTFEIIDEPYTLSGRQYVKVKNPKTNTIRQVRWYSENEYYKMYPEEAHAKAAAVVQPIRSLKEVLGFELGYITIFKGDTYTYLEWFQQSIARYHKIWGWYIISTDEVPAELPPQVEAKRLYWKDIALDDDTLKPESAITEHLDTLRYEESVSEYVGKPGDRLEVEIEVVGFRRIDGYYGSSNIITMEDANGNVYVWITSARSWQVGEKKVIKGTVKEHKTFRNVKQTYLTRCAEVV